jgi:copper chaperone CopZ
MPERVYEVPEVSCEHCVRAISEEVGGVAGVTAVEVDLVAKRVTVRGEAEDGPVRTAIEDAGYEVAP